jgi:hypothetical protein
MSVLDKVKFRECLRDWGWMKYWIRGWSCRILIALIAVPIHMCILLSKVETLKFLQIAHDEIQSKRS